MFDTPKPDPVLSHNRTVLLDALRAAGAAYAVITYSGFGDSGNANAIQILDTGGQEVHGDQAVSVLREDGRYVYGQWQSTQSMGELSLRDALDAFADRALDRYHPGFEDNDGGEGEITFDVAAGTVCMAHRDFYVESTHTETDL